MNRSFLAELSRRADKRLADQRNRGEVGLKARRHLNVLPHATVRQQQLEGFGQTEDPPPTKRLVSRYHFQIAVAVLQRS